MRPALGRTQYLRHDQRKSGSQCLGRGSYCFGAVVLTCRRAHISLNASGAERDASGLVYLEREWCRGRVLDCQGLRHLDGKGACAKLRQYKPTGRCSISRRDGPRWHVRRKFSSKGSMSTDMVVVVRLAMLDRADYAMWSNQGWGGRETESCPTEPTGRGRSGAQSVEAVRKARWADKRTRALSGSASFARAAAVGGVLWWCWWWQEEGERERASDDVGGVATVREAVRPSQLSAVDGPRLMRATCS